MHPDSSRRFAPARFPVRHPVCPFITIVHLRFIFRPYPSASRTHVAERKPLKDRRMNIDKLFGLPAHPLLMHIPVLGIPPVHYGYWPL